MGRSGYSDDCDDNWQWIRWNGAVAKAIRGKRGQEFFVSLIAALDAMPEHRLIRNDLQRPDGSVCSLGSLMVAKGIDPKDYDPEAHEDIGLALNIAPCLVREVENENDDCGHDESPEGQAERWQRMRDWAEGNIKKATQE